MKKITKKRKYVPFEHRGAKTLGIPLQQVGSWNSATDRRRDEKINFVTVEVKAGLVDGIYEPDIGEVKAKLFAKIFENTVP